MRARSLLLSGMVLCLVALAAAQPTQFADWSLVKDYLPFDNDQTEAMAFGDVDGDGDDDLVIGNEWSRNKLYLNNGRGTFTDVTAQRMPFDSDPTRAVALLDVDVDGDLDLVIGNASFRQNKLYLNDGTGTFTDVTFVHLPGDSDVTEHLGLGDVDGDNDVDIVVGNYGQSRLYLNDGTGRFSDGTAGRLPTHATSTRAIALGDVDGDNDLDLVLGNTSFGFSPDFNMLYLNNGSGVFTNVTEGKMPLGRANTLSLALGDVDGDNDADLIVGNQGQNRLLQNDGTGTFADVTAAQLPVDNDYTAALGLRDVDGDGDPDLVLGNAARTRLYLNDGAGTFIDATAGAMPAESGLIKAVVVDDVDGDTDLDLVLGHATGSGRQNRMYLNNGSGVFRNSAQLRVPGTVFNPRAVAVGDVDGDSVQDIVIGNSNMPRAGLYLNDGTGAFDDVSAERLPSHTSNVSADAVALGDVDGDSDLDILIAGRNQLYLNGGTGFFTDVTTSHLPSFTSGVNVRDAKFADVDGDSDLDIVFASGVDNQGRLFLNDGTGTYTDVSAQRMPLIRGDAREVVAGDVDGDGDLDLAFGHEVGKQNRLLINDGNGFFTDGTAARLPVDSDHTQDLDFADVDSDGDLDLIMANGSPLFGSQQNTLYLNDGAGFFTDATLPRMPASQEVTYGLAVGDVDGDGDPDVVFYDTPNNVLYLNDGSGTFADVSAFRLPAGIGNDWALELADTDGDEDLDLVFGTQQRVFTNRHFQIRTPRFPALGVTYDVQMFAKPGYSATRHLATPILGGSLLPTPFPFPTLGTLYVSPWPVSLSPVSIPQAAGVETYQLPIPSVSSLIGVQLFFQGLILNEARAGEAQLTGYTADVIL